LTDAIFSAVDHLVRDGAPFASALAGPGDARTAIARALETIDGDLPVGTPGNHGVTDRLEALLLGRLVGGLKRGDVPAGIDVSELAVFYTGVAVSLVVEALSGAEPRRLAAIRRVALRLLPEPALAEL
jgi:hypothetical protein